MNLNDIASVAGPIAAVLAPLLVFLAAQNRLRHDRGRSHSADEAGLWERMATMVDRYGKRADELDASMRKLRGDLDAAERRAGSLEAKVLRLTGMVSRWRAYARALARQMEAAGLIPVNLVDFGLDPDDPLDAPDDPR